ncbi:uncharacterized protein CELE_Y34F4.4 [Caenorhabditis elegans]|uniref:Transmembrane protein n=1 Tax=Caenorhabditis elegans TaxID=6239 RepID=Q95XC3_CAEEL|nr:Transmembrane protein [Caenorhabditis elegans]CCD68898.2 Transmembrane protein [Caenorhabditis elegans]|eukprot:NP_497316.3 Uncharacterized protein CELE_Y34F4.4 [Caenorhabditis elegans]
MIDVSLVFLGISITIGYGINIFAVATPCFYEEIYFDSTEDKNATRCHRLNPFSDLGFLFVFQSILIYLTIFCYCIMICAYWWIFQGILVKKCGYTRQILIVLFYIVWTMVFILILSMLSMFTWAATANLNSENNEWAFFVLFPAFLFSFLAVILADDLLQTGVRNIAKKFPNESLPPRLKGMYRESNVEKRLTRLEKRCESKFEQRLLHLEQLNSNLEQRLSDLEQDLFDSQQLVSDFWPQTDIKYNILKYT